MHLDATYALPPYPVGGRGRVVRLNLDLVVAQLACVLRHEDSSVRERLPTRLVAVYDLLVD